MRPVETADGWSFPANSAYARHRRRGGARARHGACASVGEGDTAISSLQSIDGGLADDQPADLLRKVASGDRTAFAELYRVTSGKVFGVAVRILGRGPAAEDVVQDVYLKVWGRAGDYDRSKGSAIAWLAAIARHRALDEARRSTRSPERELGETFDAAADVQDPLGQRDASERLGRLLDCLGGLEQEKREIILLAYYRGLSRDALARRYDMPVATVKTWLRRGLAQLKLCLSS